MNLLIVDDEASSRKLLRVNLEAAGHSVMEAADGAEALDLLKRHGPGRPDAVISDILMPRMDGYRLCYEMRCNPSTSHLPIMVYSATYTSAADELLALDIGADRFFRKPGSFREMMAALKGLAAAGSSRHATPPDHSTVLKEYSEALVLKLEKKSIEAEHACAELRQANIELRAKTEELERAKAELHRTAEMLEVRVRERTSELHSANRELEAFNASVSHDLSQPLSAILMFSELMLRDQQLVRRPSVERNLRRIVEAAGRMREIIEALMVLARLGRATVNWQPVDLNELAKSIVARLREAQPDRRVEIDIAPNLGVMGDKALLRVVLENLLQNAWKFTAKKLAPASIEIGVQANGEQSVYFVRDNGAGFSMHEADRLFQPFQRLHQQRDFPGTGIGLTTVQRIIERHGGAIWAAGEPDRGATFYFTLGPEPVAAPSVERGHEHGAAQLRSVAAES